jgi:hypothetical protein
MGKKIDWFKLFELVKSIGLPLAQSAAENGFKFRKTTKTEIAELKEQVAVLKEAVEKLLTEKIEADGND